jgi:phosphatidyl-myo-inositol dimannoside synthase
MHIGMIALEFPPQTGGMQVMALQIAEQLSARHKVTVCVPKDGAQPSTRQFETIANLRGKPDKDKKVLNELDVDVWLAMNAGYASIAGELSRPFAAYFHGNDFLAPWVALRSTRMKILRRIPLVRRILQGAINEDARRSIKRGLLHCRAVFTNSNYTKALVRNHFGEDRAVIVCPPAVKRAFLQSRKGASWGEQRSSLRLLSVSRLERGRKNIDGVLRAVAALKDKLQFEYVVVGDGGHRKILQRQSRDLGLQDVVKFLGRVTDEKLLELYRWADLFVLPVKASGSDVEGFGIVYLEAAASGLPVLGSLAGGATEAIIDGETGIILRSSEPAAIAEGILSFVENKQKFEPERIRAFAAQFTWENTAARIERELVSI